MMNQRISQSKMRYLVLPIVALILLVVSACAGSASPETVTVVETVVVERVVEVEVEKEIEVIVEEEAAAAEEAMEEESAAEPESQTSNLAPISDRPNVYNRLIIKNAEIEMLVGDTDTYINRSLGIVTEYRGYVVSNRTWFTDDDRKHASLTIGVPSENFEEMLRRFKDLAITIVDENVSGQDVTDEFVDLGSRLTNLEATAGRIREFLVQAETVEESLEVNAQLSNIEAEIEQVKGRMAYLRERASFSTITLQVSPRVIVPTPTLSPTPTPTATPVPWSAGQTLNKATTVSTNAAISLFQTGVDLTIWFVIVYLPFLLPIAIIIWLGVRIVRRMLDKTTVQPPAPEDQPVQQ